MISSLSIYIYMCHELRFDLRIDPSLMNYVIHFMIFGPWNSWFVHTFYICQFMCMISISEIFIYLCPMLILIDCWFMIMWLSVKGIIIIRMWHLITKFMTSFLSAKIMRSFKIHRSINETVIYKHEILNFESSLPSRKINSVLLMIYNSWPPVTNSWFSVWTAV